MTFRKTIFILFILFILSGVIFQLYNFWTRTLEQRYVIGYITDIMQGFKGSPSFYFKYSISGKEYEFHIPGSYAKILLKGKKFYITVPKNHPNMGVILVYRPVPQHLSKLQPPSEGWSFEELKEIDSTFTIQELPW